MTVWDFWPPLMATSPSKLSTQQTRHQQTRAQQYIFSWGGGVGVFNVLNHSVVFQFNFGGWEGGKRGARGWRGLWLCQWSRSFSVTQCSLSIQVMKKFGNAQLLNPYIYGTLISVISTMQSLSSFSSSSSLKKYMYFQTSAIFMAIETNLTNSYCHFFNQR